MVRAAEALTASGIGYLLAGSFSSNYYGIPRSTKDADFVVELRGGVGRDFMARLGADFEADPQLTFETNTGAYRQSIPNQRVHMNEPPETKSLRVKSQRAN